MPAKTGQNSEFSHAIIHYAEIALKGKNRPQFENLLISNIRHRCGKLVGLGKRESGQLTLLLAQTAGLAELRDILSGIPGIAYFSFAKKTGIAIGELAAAADQLLKDREFSTFKIEARRRDKTVPLTSPEYNVRVGDALQNAEGKRADMKNPDIRVKIEIHRDGAYVSAEDIEGIGGMPTDQRQKVIVLLSGGFDSPVAAYMMMKRGCEAAFVHFHNRNQSSAAMKQKIVSLSAQLSKFQIRTRLFIVPFDALQKELIMKAKAELRMILYRQFMLRIASRIAENESAKFLVVGDSLAQVASQTFENLSATYRVAEADTGMHIFSPLIGMDKKDIIWTARAIGTYDISSLPYGDCCSYFVPKHPMLRADEEMIRSALGEFDAEKLIEEAAAKAELKEWN